jgi:16S rRNA processing protein RimM
MTDLTADQAETQANPVLVPVPADHVQVGAVIGTHGNDGRLRVEPDTDNPARFATGGTFAIAGNTYNVVHVANAAAGRVLLIGLAEVTTREQAAALVHQAIVAPIVDTPSLPSDTYYHFQLIDLRVSTVAGEDLGVITEILTTGANDVYVVTAATTELMIPALGDVIIGVDITAGTMTIDLPEGIEPRNTVPKPKRKPPRRQSKRSQAKSPSKPPAESSAAPPDGA